MYDRGATAFMDLSLVTNQVFTGGTTERLSIGDTGLITFKGPLVEKGHFDNGGGLTGTIIIILEHMVMFIIIPLMQQERLHIITELMLQQV